MGVVIGLEPQSNFIETFKKNQLEHKFEKNQKTSNSFPFTQSGF